MSAHDKSTILSQHFCDSVVDHIEAEIGDAARKQAENVCSVGKYGRFAYVYHRPDSLRIYLRCQEADGELLSSLVADRGVLTLSKRHTVGNDWAQATPYYVDLNSDSGVIGAIPLLLYVARIVKPAVYLLPSEAEASEMLEGRRTTVEVNRFERDSAARKLCITIFGTVCTVCEFDFGRTYGEIGTGFIHVHHLTPLSMIGEQYKVDARKDLRPVCPNCHEMLHRKTPPLSIEELKARIEFCKVGDRQRVV